MSVSRMVIVGLFVAAGMGFVVVEALSRRQDSTVPGFGDLTATVLRFRLGRVPVGRIGVYGFWWWVGWHFFAR
jgi:hypothetical protein